MLLEMLSVQDFGGSMCSDIFDVVHLQLANLWNLPAISPIPDSSDSCSQTVCVNLVWVLDTEGACGHTRWL